MIVGPAMPSPMTPMCPGASARANSSNRIAWCVYGAPWPPYSCGQVSPAKPASYIFRLHTRGSSAGRFAWSQARTSLAEGGLVGESRRSTTQAYRGGGGKYSRAVDALAEWESRGLENCPIRLLASGDPAVATRLDCTASSSARSSHRWSSLLWRSSKPCAGFRRATAATVRVRRGVRRGGACCLGVGRRSAPRRSSRRRSLLPARARGRGRARVPGRLHGRAGASGSGARSVGAARALPAASALQPTTTAASAARSS